MIRYRSMARWFRRWSPLLLAFIIAAMAVALFWPATGYDFLNLDDDRYVAGNVAVRNGLTVPGLHWAFTTVYEAWWLPVLWISYMADTSLWGQDPFGYHLSNVLLHAINAALLFWVLARMTGCRGRSALVAALFAFHPLRVESVAWIAARKDVLSGLFFFLGLLAYLRHVEKPRSLWRWTLPPLMLLGLMSKAILVIFPFCLLLLDVWPLRRATALRGRAAWNQWYPLLREKLPLFALSLGFILLNMDTHRVDGPLFTRLPPLDRLALVFPNYWDYLKQVFWPVHLSIFHPENDVVRWPLSFVALGGMAAVSLFCLHLRKTRPYLLVGWLWFLLGLFPVIRGVRFGLAAYADRFTYLPSIGLAMALVWAAADLFPRRPGRGAVLTVLAAVLLAACAGQTRAVLPLWQNSLSAFGRVIRDSPLHSMPYHNYAQALVEAGRIEESLPYFEKVIAHDPHITLYYANFGTALLLLGRVDEALLRMESARQRLNPGCPLLNSSLGLAWLEKDEPEKAIPYLRRAIAAAPDHPIWRVELARAYLDAGQDDAFATELDRIAAAGLPQLASLEGLHLYYRELWKSSHRRRAWTFFRRAARENPSDIPLLNNTAWFLATRPPPGVDPAEALRLAQQVHALAGDAHPGILDTLAAAQAANGRFAEAIQTAEQALQKAQAAGDADLAGQIEQRLDAYRRGQPWRE